jgi:hypothetical protein
MAAAAKMATPPGAGPLPAPITPPEEPQQGTDPTQIAALEEKQRKEIAGKDKEIADLRTQASELKIQMQQLKMQADIQNKQQQMLDKVRAEQKELDKKQTEFAAAEVKHKAQLQKDTAEQEVVRARQESKSLADIAKREAQSLVDIAKRDADSAKATANDNAKSYIKMTEDARRSADSYMAGKQQAFDRQTEAAKKNSPYMSVALQSQIKGALAAANNVGKLRSRVAKDNAKWNTMGKVASAAPQTAAPAPQQPAAGGANQEYDIVRVPEGVTKVPSNWEPHTSGTAYNVERRTYKVPKQPAANAPQQPSAYDQNKQQEAEDALVAKQRQITEAQTALRESQQAAATRQVQARRMATMMPQFDENASLADRQRALATARGRLQYMRNNPGKYSKSDLSDWQDAINQQQYAYDSQKAYIEQKAKSGDAAAQEQMHGLQDANYRRSDGFGGIFGLGGKTELQRIEEAARHGMTPEQYAQHKEDQRGWFSKTIGFLGGDALSSLGNSIADWRESASMAERRGVNRGFFDSGMEGKEEAMEAYREAAKRRNLATGWGSNLGSVGANAGLAAMDVLGNVAFATGIGGAVAAGAKALGRHALRSAGTSLINNSLKATGKQVWKGIANQATKSLAEAGGKATLGRTIGAYARPMWDAAKTYGRALIANPPTAQQAWNGIKTVFKGAGDAPLQHLKPFRIAENAQMFRFGADGAAMLGSAITGNEDWMKYSPTGFMDSLASTEAPSAYQTQSGHYRDAGGNVYSPSGYEMSEDQMMSPYHTYGSSYTAQNAAANVAPWAPHTGYGNIYKQASGEVRPEEPRPHKPSDTFSYKPGQFDMMNGEMQDIMREATENNDYKSGLSKMLNLASPFVEAATGFKLSPQYEMPLNAGEILDPVRAVKDTFSQDWRRSWGASAVYPSSGHQALQRRWAASKQDYEFPTYTPGYGHGRFGFLF